MKLQLSIEVNTMISVQRTNPTAPNDHYVRMTSEAIWRLTLQHRSSEITVQSPCEGFTQWIARIDKKLLSVSWDWVRLDDGALVQPVPRIVLSNVMMVDAFGCDRGMDLTGAALQAVVDSTDWKPTVAKVCWSAVSKNH
ncbi:hypothetical protein J2W49_004028 [Hydrogenophaga palleronii]|uniref:DUF4902 domain-containing protein n=1 Tax=Hydrogenophaga palleronii TaxID=65655 RepID=A0ABU1WRX7_9BURK|nr:hypothetical protein [Hydrogenophaga palleronii]